MKHCQSKHQSTLLRFVAGFLAGLAAWTQMFSEADAASVLEAARRKKQFCSGSLNISDNLTVVAAYLYAQRCKQVTVKCSLGAGPW